MGGGFSPVCLVDRSHVLNWTNPNLSFQKQDIGLGTLVPLCCLFVNQTGLNFLPHRDIDFRPQFAKKAPPPHALHPLSLGPGWVYECTQNMSSFHALMICTHPPFLYAVQGVLDRDALTKGLQTCDFGVSFQHFIAILGLKCQ